MVHKRLAIENRRIKLGPMKIKDRYILRLFLTIFILALFAFLLIFHIVDVIEKIDKFIRAKMSPAQVAGYYWFQLPFFIQIGIPMALLLAAVFTIGTMGKHNELAALKSAGISLYRMSVPLLTVGLLLSVAAFFFEDQVVIPFSRKRMEIEQNQFRQRHNLRRVITDVTFQDSPDVNIVIGKYTTDDQLAVNVTIQRSRNHILRERLDARKMIWLPQTGQWQLVDFKIRRFDEAGNESIQNVHSDSLLMLNVRPDDLIRSELNPETMRYTELRQFIERMVRSGNDPTRWRVNLYFKIAFPFTNFIVILFGVPLAAMKEKKGISFGAGMSLLVIFSYYGFIKFGQVLGYQKILNPLMAVWLGNLIFLLAGSQLLFRIRQ